MKLVLKKNSDFVKLYHSGKRCFASGIMMYYTNSTALKFGIAVSKKYGGSVKRNRVKRLIRAAFRQINGDIAVKVNIIFVPKPGFLHTLENVKKSMVFMLKKEGLLSDVKNISH